MGNKIIKVGNLVYVTSIGRNDVGYGNVLSITDRETGELYEEKECVTGWGDKNTRVDVQVRVIAKCKSPSSGGFWDLSNVIQECEPFIKDFDPHNVIRLDKELFKKSYEDTLQIMKQSLDWIILHDTTREERINSILDEG